MNLFLLFFKQCVRSKEVVISLMLVFSLGLLSIGIGYNHLALQQDEIAEVAQHQKEHFARQVELHNEDLGLLLYYTKFAFIHSLSPLGGLSVGQSDLNPTVKQLTIKTFEAQRFDTDLVNPSSLHAGNLDLAFVILFLFPLLVIVLTFNLIAEETESGTWKLVAVQAKSIFGFVFSKLLVRMCLLYLLLFFLLVAAKLALQIPYNGHFLTVILLSSLYLFFWFVLSFFVICFKQSSGYNALILLSTWLVLLLLLPAGVNAYITGKYPIPEAMSTAIAQRDGYHMKWDTNKRETIEKFYQHYPQFESFGYPTEGFNWLWYYAMQQMGDDDSNAEQMALDEKIRLREKSSVLISSLIPNLHFMLTLNQLAGTSMQQNMDYLNEAEAYHERLRLFFYPKVFEELHADTIDWSQIKPVFHLAEIPVKPLDRSLPLILAILLVGIITLPYARNL